MNTNFARGTVAHLTFTLPGGERHDIEFSHLSQIHCEHEPADVYVCGGWRELCGQAQSATFTLKGVVVKTTLTPAKKSKPEKATKRPGVKASAALVKNSTAKHARLTKQILEAERTLELLKNEKNNSDTALKIARELLVLAASGEK